MINYNNYVYLRYVLLVNIIAALIPSMTVKGRANDPLLHSTCPHCGANLDEPMDNPA
jgi:hypothetical protein